MPLKFSHSLTPTHLSSDVAVYQTGSVCHLTVTLPAVTSSAYGQLVMWWSAPSNPTFGTPQALLPVPGEGNVGAAEGSPPTNTTLFLGATPSAPAVFTLGWSVPSTLASPYVGFFFQAVDQSDQGAPRNFVPGDALNAQYNFTVTLSNVVVASRKRGALAPQLGPRG
jgi:hypothetical protein